MNRAIALLSAALFGVSTPAAKLLLGTIDPAVLAGLLYCGAGLGIAVIRRAGRLASRPAAASEAALGRKDVPYLAGAIVAGGIVGPGLLTTGLQHTEASAAALLLTLEGVATALMAWFIFYENFDRRIALSGLRGGGRSISARSRIGALLAFGSRRSVRDDGWLRVTRRCRTAKAPS